MLFLIISFKCFSRASINSLKLSKPRSTDSGIKSLFLNALKKLLLEKSEGMKQGRPKGSLSKKTKLSGKEEAIKALLEKDIGYSTIGRIFGVNRLTVKNFVESQNLQ